VPFDLSDLILMMSQYMPDGELKHMT